MKDVTVTSGRSHAGHPFCATLHTLCPLGQCHTLCVELSTWCHMGEWDICEHASIVCHTLSTVLVFGVQHASGQNLTASVRKIQQGVNVYLAPNI
eukprot:m.765873 g.765873  ORF g.765873 m.765873 type:complete len:95 (-) comp23223_c0_seq24:484-768(-)